MENERDKTPEIDTDEESYREFLKSRRKKKKGTNILLVFLIIIIVLCIIGIAIGSGKTDRGANIIADDSTTSELTILSNDNTYEWSAGELEYLGMTRSEIIEVYRAYDILYSAEVDNYDTEEELAQFSNKCSQTVAQDYDISAEDVEQIWKYGSVPNYFATFDVSSVNVKNGETISVITQGTNVSISVKVNLLYTNAQTITQNYENVFYLILNYTGVDFDSISYEATADIDEEYERKIVSFDLTNQSVIDQIAKGEMTDYESLGNYVDNLYILQSLRDDD